LQGREKGAIQQFGPNAPKALNLKSKPPDIVDIHLLDGACWLDLVVQLLADPVVAAILSSWSSVASAALVAERDHGIVDDKLE
jgi:hypothetical protein